MSHFKNDIPKSNAQIAEWMNEIFIAGEIHSEIVRQKFTIYSISSWPLSKDYMETRRSVWYYKDFTAEQVRSMGLKKYNNLPTSGRWSTKDPKDAQVLALVGVTQKIADDSTKSSDKSNNYRKTTEEDPVYIRDLPPWILEEPTCVVGNTHKDGK